MEVPIFGEGAARIAMRPAAGAQPAPHQAEAERPQSLRPQAAHVDILQRPEPDVLDDQRGMRKAGVQMSERFVGRLPARPPPSRNWVHPSDMVANSASRSRAETASPRSRDRQPGMKDSFTQMRSPGTHRASGERMSRRSCVLPPLPRLAASPASAMMKGSATRRFESDSRAGGNVVLLVVNPLKAGAFMMAVPTPDVAPIGKAAGKQIATLRSLCSSGCS